MSGMIEGTLSGPFVGASLFAPTALWHVLIESVVTEREVAMTVSEYIRTD